MLVKTSAEPLIPTAQDLKGHQSLIDEVADFGRDDLYFFCKAILGYKDMNVECHGKMCDFLANKKWRRKALYYPRLHFKTTIGSIGEPLHNTVNDPTWSTLWIHENEDKAVEEILDPLKSHFLNNPMFRMCYPEMLHENVHSRSVKWKDRIANIKRPSGYTGPVAFEVMGVHGKGTGKHRRQLVLDDIFADIAANSIAEAEHVIKFFKGISSLLISPGEDFINIYGTRWHMSDLMDHILREIGGVILNQEGTEVAKVTSTDPQYLIWIRSWLNIDGSVIFPKRMTPNAVKALKIEHGSTMFSFQYENNPVDPTNTSINPINLRYWSLDISGSIRIHDPYTNQYSRPYTADECDCIMVLDPAVGLKEHHSRTAIVMLWMTPDKQVIVRDVWAKRARKTNLTDPSNPGWLDQMYIFQRKYHPRVSYFEAVAFQKSIGENDIKDRNLTESEPMNIEEIPHLGMHAKQKDIRIRSYLQPITEAHLLSVNAAMTLAIEEISQHPFARTKDIVDCIAHGGRLLIQPATLEESEIIDAYEESGHEVLGIDTGYGVNY